MKNIFTRITSRLKKKPKDLGVYNYAFTDDNGLKWYRLKSFADYNIIRLAKQKEFYTFLSAAISGEELEHILVQMEKALHEGLQNPRAAAKVAAMIYQIRERKTYCVHTDLFLNIIACDLLREDEDLVRGGEIKEPFDQSIHEEKVEWLRKKAFNNDGFFLNLPEYKQLASILQISEIPFKELQENYSKHLKLLHESLKIYNF